MKESKYKRERRKILYADDMISIMAAGHIAMMTPIACAVLTPRRYSDLIVEGEP